MEKLVYDIETNGLLRDANEIHCIVTVDVDTKEVLRFHDYWDIPGDGTLSDGIRKILGADCRIGHNTAAYDDVILQQIGNINFPEEQSCIDTMLWSCILFPEMQKNSLEEWARRLKLEEQKVQNENWNRLTENMLNRCVSDCLINLKLFNHLLKVTKKIQGKNESVDLRKAIRLECDVGNIHGKQVLHGVGYDVEFAEEFLKKLDIELEELTEKIQTLAPKRIVNPYNTEVNKPFLKNGEYSSAVKSWFGDDLQNVNVCGPFTRISIESINLNSDEQVKKFLLDLGWEATEWNFKKEPGTKKFIRDSLGNFIKTSPKLTEDSFDSIPEGLGQDIARYNTLKHRRSQLQSFNDETNGTLPLAKENMYDGGKIGNVPAEAFTCGTNTARYRHRVVANLPKVKKLYGVESRRVYVAPPGSMQVGADLSGVEARALCELCYDYPGGKEFAELVLNGDWHSRNASIWNVSRDTAKTILYAMMYGAGLEKLGKEAGGGSGLGEQIKKLFMQNNPAYAMLVSDLEEQYKENKTFIVGLDGRPFYPRNKKDILNTAIQGNCAILFKHWMVNCNKLEDVISGYAHQMIAYHDELQFAYYRKSDDYNPECFAQKVCEEAVNTGRQLGFRVPIEAQYKVGRNYAECH